MSKRQLSKIADTCVTKKEREPFVQDTFSIGFETTDFSCRTRDNSVSITAVISKEEFDKIIYSYGIYIAEFLKEKVIKL